MEGMQRPRRCRSCWMRSMTTASAPSTAVRRSWWTVPPSRSIPWRDHGGRTAEADLHAQLGQRVQVGARHPRVADVPDDGDGLALERAEPFAQREAVEQALAGCLCAPSPAETTAQPTWRARKLGAPLAAWRTTSTSGRMASRFFAVSSRVSPLVVDDWAAVQLSESAESTLAAISNELRVRVGGLEEQVHDVLAAQGRDLLSPGATAPPSWRWARYRAPAGSPRGRTPRRPMR